VAAGNNKQLVTTGIIFGNNNSFAIVVIESELFLETKYFPLQEK